jgi:uncharacterized membrane protein
MDRLSLLLSFAIVWISISYFLFTGQQYFSAITLFMIIIVALSSSVVFVLAYRYSSSGRLVSNVWVDRQIIIFLAVISILAIYVAYYDAAGPAIYNSIPIILLLVSIGVLVSILGIYAIRKITKNMRSYALWLAVVLCSLVIASAAYATMYSLRHVNWGGIDELAFNYYASYLFVHGTNPYVASMQQILQQRNIYPTVQLNGTFEYAYDYPALSFVPYVFMPLFKVTNFFTFILMVIFLTVIMAYYIYRKSEFNKLVLLPIGVWLFVTYTLVGTVNQYLAVSVLFLIAYVERKRVVVSGILLGLAASIIQLVWFAIPFLYILLYRENGGKNLVKCIGATLLAFAIVNSYFLIISPKVFINNVFLVFGLNKLVFFGPNIMQFLVAFYPVAQWYSATISIVALLAFLALFYIYTDTLKPFIAVVPIMIFFLAWRNISIYGIPFIPVIIAIYYVNEKDKVADLLRDRRPILYSVAALAVVFAVLAVIAHGQYVKADELRIGTITPIIYGQQGPIVNGQSTIVGPYSLGGLRINVKNNANYTQPVSFYVISRNPNNYDYILSSQLNMTIPARASTNYTLQYRLPAVSNGTKLYIFAFSQYYTTSREYQLSLKR